MKNRDGKYNILICDREPIFIDRKLKNGEGKIIDIISLVVYIGTDVYNQLICRHLNVFYNIARKQISMSRF